MAARGFNIALVSRSRAKLDAVAKRCQTAGAQTRIVEADFSLQGKGKKTEIEAFYRNIYRQLEDLDVSILVNNAGVMYTQQFHSLPADSPRWRDTVDVNVMQVAMMTALFRDKLLARANKGKHAAIINVSSMIAYVHGCPGAAVYAASKVFVNYLTVALAQELAGKVDVQCLTPNLTRTKLISDYSLKASSLASISANSVAVCSLRDLGHQGLVEAGPLGTLLTGDVMTGGHIFHDIQVPIYKLVF